MFFLMHKERAGESTIQKKMHPFLGQLLNNSLLSVIKGAFSPRNWQSSMKTTMHSGSRELRAGPDFAVCHQVV